MIKKHAHFSMTASLKNDTVLSGLVRLFLLLACLVFIFTNSKAQTATIGTGTFAVQTGGTYAVTSGNIVISSGGTFNNAGTIKLAGDWTNSGTYTDVSGTVNFTSAAAQAFNATGTGSFYKLILNNSSTGLTMNNDMTVNNSSTLTAGELKINDKTLTANGTFNYGTGTLTGSDSSKLIIGGTAGSLQFTPAPTAAHSLKNLTLSVNTASATLGSDLDIYGNVKLNDGSLALASQHLTLKSNSTNTATIDKLLADGSNLTGADNVTAERWIPLTNPGSGTGRRYQLLTPTVTTISSIQTNWMEGGQVTSVGGTSNPVANYGTHITGSSNLANHLDRTQTDQPSLFSTTNSTTEVYNAFTDANGTLDAKRGYFLFIRGDRSISLSLFNTNQAAYGWVNLPSTNTTLRANGSIVKGPVTSFANAFLGTIGARNLITNPYPAPIDWSLVSRTHVAGSYKYWDPHNGQRGGFVDVDNSGISTPTSSATQYLQPGQAFFVIADGTGTPTVSIQESNKAVGFNNTPVFLIPPQNFSASLFYYEGGVNRRLADGVRAIYDDAYSSAFIGTEDAIDMPNWDENMSIPRDGYNLVVDKRPVIINRDTMPLLINSLKVANYELEFTGQSFTNSAISATLIDNFTSGRTPLSVTGTTVVPITVSSAPASSATDRFLVVFGTSGPLPIDLLNVKAYEKNTGIQVDWVMNSEQDMDKYEVEKSADGRNFTKATTVLSRGNSNVQVNYGWFDTNPIQGDNFYRIKSIDKSGHYKNSNIVRVNISKGGGTDISIYPNPFEGTGFNLQMSKLTAGKYTLTMYNNLGQRVYTGTLTHSGGSATQYIDLGKDLAAGTYTVKLSGGTTELTRTITKE